MVLLFTLTVFLSAFLLFAVQPMVAKVLLPIFGGGSSVWTTCMLFYQTVLLIGYLYAHILLTRFPKRAQIVIHCVVLVAALVAGVMFATPIAPEGGADFPVPYLLAQLALISGLPFFAIASAGSLIQGWFSRTGHARAHDPYFLYAASNAGSLIGLISYPFVIEPSFALGEQRELWLIGLMVFAVLAMIGVTLTKGGADQPATPISKSPTKKPAGNSVTTDAAAPEEITWRRRGFWVFLAFVPSSMLLGVTSYITTDIASFPLLWVIPLALYLVTMIIAFGVNAEKLVKNAARPMLVAVIASLVLLILGEQTRSGAPLMSVLSIQLLLLGVVGVYAHGRLAADRPHAGRLTEFYLMMSLGGALGGVLNGFISPLIFPGPYEYHLALIAAVATIPAMLESRKRVRMRWMMPAITLGYLILVYLISGMIQKQNYAWLDNEMVATGVVLLVLITGPAVLMYMSWKDGIACAATLSVLLAAVVYLDLSDPLVIHRARTFYGQHTVTDHPDLYENNWVRMRVLNHGTTIHGKQIVDPQLRLLPLSYYHNDGPVGVYMHKLLEIDPRPRNMGFIGLGSGAMATYGREGDSITFFEIDPEVVRIAENTDYFTYLADSKADISIETGDGRLILEHSVLAGDPVFDIIVIDAFSSDAIPVHLLTLEAMDLYFRALAPDGVLMMHISNRHLELTPVCFALGESVGAYTLVGRESLTPVVEQFTQRDSSLWVAFTRDQTIGQQALEVGYQVITSDPGNLDPWTDQSSNILDILMW